MFEKTVQFFIYVQWVLENVGKKLKFGEFLQREAESQIYFQYPDFFLFHSGRFYIFLYFKFCNI